MKINLDTLTRTSNCDNGVIGKLITFLEEGNNIPPYTELYANNKEVGMISPIEAREFPCMIEDFEETGKSYDVSTHSAVFKHNDKYYFISF
jgi:hypothetical protein